MNIEKLVEKLNNSPKNVRFEDLEKLLNFMNYFCNKKNTGSHFVFKKQGCEPLTIPYKKPIKAHYVKLVLDTYKEFKEKE